LLLEKGAEIEVKDSCHETPLWRAVTRGHEAVVRLLIEKGADVAKDAVNVQDPLSNSYGVELEKASLVWQMIENGAALDAKASYRRRTLLWRAAVTGNMAVLRLLLEKSADVEAKDYYEETMPLRQAIAEEDWFAIQKLLKHGGPPDGNRSFSYGIFRLEAN
jgi:ankyrin repeat protein